MIRIFSINVPIVLGTPKDFDVFEVVRSVKPFRFVSIAANFEYPGFCVISIERVADNVDPYAIRNHIVRGEFEPMQKVQMKGHYSGFCPLGFGLDFETKLCISFIEIDN
jgi:hypothetical protein